jgi:hypothetical protein
MNAPFLIGAVICYRQLNISYWLEYKYSKYSHWLMTGDFSGSHLIG